jgi:hypothetical protein
VGKEAVVTNERGHVWNSADDRCVGCCISRMAWLLSGEPECYSQALQTADPAHVPSPPARRTWPFQERAGPGVVVAPIPDAFGRLP